ncbi:MAG: hypothetical protein IKD13_04155 [Firmicutes bacterium]|nr:hypothetical protein [Bacillota bacterium]
MRKHLAILLALVVASAGMITWAHGTVNAAGNDIEIRETVIYGDNTAVEGLEVGFNTKYMDNFYWDTTFWPGTDQKPVTEGRYISDSAHNPDNDTMSNETWFTITPDKDEDRLSWAFYGDDSEGSLELDEGHLWDGMVRPMLALALETERNSRETRTDQLNEFYEYYPFSVDYSIGQYTQSGDGSRVVKFFDVFRIKVPDDHIVESTVEKNEDGLKFVEIKPSEIMDGPADIYDLTTSHIVTEDGLYILIHNETNGRIALDFSDFSDGYGIYKVPIERGEITAKIYLDDIHCCYPIDPVNVMTLNLMDSQDGEAMVLMTEENSQLVLTSIRLDTMEEQARVEISGFEDDAEGIRQMFFYGDFVVVETADHTIALISMEDQGKILWTQSLQLEGTDEMLNLDTDYTVMDWDGDRLVIVTSQKPETWDREARIVVMDATGVQYIGDYDIVGDPENTLTYDREDMRYYGSDSWLYLQNKTPFEVSW